MSDMLDLVKARKPFCGGIVTAEQYAKSVLDNPKLAEYAVGAKDVADKLTFVGGEVITKATSSGDFKSLMPDEMDVPEGTLMVVRHTLTATEEDRDLDVLEAKGARFRYSKGVGGNEVLRLPSLWQHIHSIPVGKAVAVVEQDDKRVVVVSALIDLNEMTSDIVKLVAADVLSWSHGFIPIRYEERQAKLIDGVTGFRVTEFEVMEESYVSVPSCRAAENELYATEKFASPLIKGYAESRLREDMTGHVRGANVESDPMPVVRYVKGAGGFDPSMEHLEASTLEYDWAAKFIGCQMKDLIVTSTFVPYLRAGSYFTGEAELMAKKEYSKVDQRSLTSSGKETPLRHTVVPVTPDKSVSFVSHGLEFHRTPKGNVVVKHREDYGGYGVVTYAADDAGQELIDDTWAWAIENNFLKGQAFSLGGDFITRGSVALSDVFLEVENEDVVRRTVSLLDKKDAGIASRGIIMSGPPGTGKTMSCKALLAQTDTTFIWVSARDFWKFGSVNGICSAFDMARELSPAVVVFEDVDNWLTTNATDLLKTEMDGVAESRGVVTVVTTNYPERLPDALIDRPGRFHDVCEFHLPSKAVRRRMLHRWGGESLDTKAVDAIADITSGYSGAHMYELVAFAKTLCEESSAVSLQEALVAAVRKIDKQRELINANQLAGSTYRPNVRGMDDVSRKLFAARVAQDFSDKGGRTLSAANLRTLEEVADDLDYMHGMDKMPREAKAMCKGCSSKLHTMIDGAKPQEEEQEETKSAIEQETHKHTTLGDVLAFVLAAEPRDLKTIEATVSETRQWHRHLSDAAELRQLGILN